MEGREGGGGGEQTHCSRGGERSIVKKTDSLCGRTGWGKREGHKRTEKGETWLFFFFIDAPLLFCFSSELEVIHNPALGDTSLKL